MNTKNVSLLTLILLGLVFTSRAQTLTFPCPSNSDFEMGDYSGWSYYYGTCCTGTGLGTMHISSATTTPPAAALIPCSFALTGPAGSATPIVTGIDPFGGFPVVGSGNYSMRIGSTRTEQWAENVEYYVHVPAGVSDYSLVYQYAVVLENPSHPASEQPRFLVEAIDSATNTVLPASSFFYSAPSCHTCAGSIPGFVGPVGNAFAAVPNSCINSAYGAINALPANVYYKSWSTATANLSGYNGHTIIMSFAAGDCALGGHFGYGYIDMTCGAFAISALGCVDSITLSGPPGFSSYSWYDSSTFSVLYGTTDTIIIPTPPTPTTYAVILTPYTGFGSTDTLYVHVPLTIPAITGPDSVCAGSTLTLSDASPGGEWSSTPPSIATIGSTTGIVTGVSGGDAVISYAVSAGCVTTFTVTVAPSPCTLGINSVPANDILEIFPNPVNSELTIKTGAGIYNAFTITNGIGQVFIRQQLTGTLTSVNIIMLPPGLYYCTLKGPHSSTVQKFVKE